MKKHLIISVVLAGILFLSSCSNVVTTKKSNDNAFEILKMVESNNKSVVFSIRDSSDDFEKMLFYSSRYSYTKVTNAYWANMNNDFFVLSHDIGVQVYIFNNNTWESGYIIKITKSQQNKYSANLVKVPKVDDVELSVEYNIDNIPKEVLNYLKQVN